MATDICGIKTSRIKECELLSINMSRYLILQQLNKFPVAPKHIKDTGGNRLSHMKIAENVAKRESENKQNMFTFEESDMNTMIEQAEKALSISKNARKVVCLQN